MSASITGTEVNTYDVLDAIAETDNKNFTITIKKGEEDVTANYDVTVAGKLTITKADVASYNATVSLDDWTYGENAKEENPSVAGPGSNAYAEPTYTYYAEGSETALQAKPTNAGKYKVVATWAATDNLPQLTAEDTFTINKRDVVITTDSATRVYNGQTLTAPGTIEGIVDNETVDFSVTGTRTEVGSETNTYSLSWTGTASESNYQIIAENLGALTVIAQSIDPTDPTEPTDDPNQPVYNGVQVSTPTDVVYNGQTQNQPIQAVDANGNALPEDAYTVTYTDAVNVGTVTVTITGQGNYAGQVTRTYQITPATLMVTTPSATKTFDGAALTNTAGTIEGLQGDDSVTFTVNGTQTAVGNSVNTYAIDWNNALANNYTIVENLGTLTVNAAPITPVTPTPTPVPAGPGAPAVAPGVPTPAAAAAAAPLAAPVATITDDATPLAAGETIDDEDTPLAAFDHVDCWVHWFILVGIILTAIYGAVVVCRRLAVVKDVDDLEDEVLDGAVAGATQSAPADNRQAI